MRTGSAVHTASTITVETEHSVSRGEPLSDQSLVVRAAGTLAFPSSNSASVDVVESQEGDGRLATADARASSVRLEARNLTSQGSALGIGQIAFRVCSVSISARRFVGFLIGPIFRACQRSVSFHVGVIVPLPDDIRFLRVQSFPIGYRPTDLRLALVSVLRIGRSALSFGFVEPFLVFLTITLHGLSVPFAGQFVGHYGECNRGRGL